MQDFLDSLLTLAAIAVWLPVGILAIEVTAATLFRGGQDRRPTTSFDMVGSIAVLIPAHNESGSIATTIQHVRQQLRSFDRIVVVADNCTDDTVSICQLENAEVAVRLTRPDAERVLRWTSVFAT